MRWVWLDENKKHNGSTESFEYGVSQMEDGEYLIPETEYFDLEIGNMARGVMMKDGKLVDVEIYDDEICEIVENMPNWWSDNSTVMDWVDHVREYGYDR